MSEPVYLTRDDGVGRWVEWYANSATHLALPRAEFEEVVAKLNAAKWALYRVMDFSKHAPDAPRALVVNLLARAASVAAEALSTPPPQPEV